MKKSVVGLFTILCILLCNVYNINADTEDNINRVENNSKNIDYSSLRDSYQSSIDKAKQYEMNMIMTLITQDKPDIYDWNAMGYSENGVAINTEPLGEFNENRLQELAGSTKAEVENKLVQYQNKAHELGSYSNEEVQALKPSCAELALLSNIEIHYYCSDNSLIQYIVSTRSDKVLFYYVLWKDGKIVDYVRRDS